jgi:hypothetical protein
VEQAASVEAKGVLDAGQLDQRRLILARLPPRYVGLRAPDDVGKVGLAEVGHRPGVADGAAESVDVDGTPW